MSIAKAGFPFIIIPLIIGVILLFLGGGWKYPGAFFILLCFFCCYFFRDPKRNVPHDEKLVISPADGRIMEIIKEGDTNVIRIFLSVFNVHLQRSPVSGKVVSMDYKPGKFLPAMDKAAHMENEQNIIKIRNANGEYTVKQIAGILARRVVSWVKKNDELKMGQQIGLIKFGSQVDISIPVSARIKVKEGDKVTGGETVLSEL
ncbi:MAG: phosphatidylserine decarboxylase family protein [Elusimicrobia bacterium]|nr:phosphatidylserine decarboxylase family protein [Candidatus Liberimonas magnetica]